LDGIRKFFAQATSAKGAVSVSSLSSQRYTTKSPNGSLYSPRFDSKDWTGTVQKTQLRLNTTTSTIESVPFGQGIGDWDAGALLTSGSLLSGPSANSAVIRPIERNIYTLRSTGSNGRGEGTAFTVENKGSFDADVLTALNTNPYPSATASVVVDNLADARIEFLRGNRLNEKTSTGGFLRTRNSIMGDIINSGPIYKAGADSTVSGVGFSEFARSIAARPPTIFVGANDGMLHAFSDIGRELFAYIPRAVSEKLNRLTHPRYLKGAYVDAVPNVREAQLGTTWRTILASGMGGGANGVFALDVTTPAQFSATHVLFEFTDKDDPYMGSVTAQPKIVKLKVGPANSTSYKWFVAVSSGYNNYIDDGFSGDGRQALFLLSLDKQSNDPWVKDGNYFRVMTGTPDTSKANGLANPGFEETLFGDVRYMYAGDLQGQLWRFDFSFGLNATSVATAVRGGAAPQPLFIAKSGAVRQPITISPQVVPALDYGFMVTFGTGKFVEPTDSQTTSTQSLYGVWDPLGNTAAQFNIERSSLYQRTMLDNATTSVSTLSGNATYTFGLTNPNYRGWFFDLSLPRERVAVEGATAFEFVAFNTTIPEGECSGDGSGRTLCLNPHYGTSTCEIRLIKEAGLLSRPNIVEVDASLPGTGNYSNRSNTGKRAVTIRQQPLSTGTTLTEAGNSVVAGTQAGAIYSTVIVPAGRLSWREIRNFKY
jgi:type IV pilus assembly protein PilY1